MALDIIIKRVKVLQDRARIEAEKQNLAPDDLVIVTTISINSFPEFYIEKIIGDPVLYLLARAKVKFP